MRLARHFPYFEYSPCSLLAIIVIFLNCDVLRIRNCFSHAAVREIDRDAQTIYYRNRPPNAVGHFEFDFQTTNGITTKAAGNEFGHSGVVQYVSLEGIPITMTYVADEDGYHPMGEHIHPVPEYVKRSLDYIQTHPAIDEQISRSL